MTILNNFRKLLSDYFPLKFGALSWFMCALQFYYLYEVFATNDTGGLSFTLWSLFVVVWSMVTVMITFQVLAHVSSKRWVTVILSGLFLIVYTLVAAYHFGAHDVLVWSVVVENLSIAFSFESLDVIHYSLDELALQYGAIIFVVFSILEVTKRTVSKVTTHPLTWKKRCGSMLLFGFIFFLPIESLDPLLNFTRSGYFYYRDRNDLNVPIQEGTYPLLREFKPTLAFQSNKKPHIFLIVVESLNASVLGKKTSQGVEYTPFLNQLRQESVHVDPFYGNSIQTAKGHFALFFSSIPSLSGKTFVKYNDVHLHSLATVLKTHAYRTIAFAAHKKSNFDNIGPFLTSHGYDDYLTVASFLKESDAELRLRWGVKDAVFFQRFFEYYDQLSDVSRPTLFSLLTIANHFPFNSMKDQDKEMYPSANSIQQDYANSIRLVDNGIREFYKELKKRDLYEDSIVIITADHAFPLGQHGNYHLEAGYHEDSFRIPFFLTWPSRLDPQQILEAHSQMDINPTVLDLLHIPVEDSNFLGQSIFSAEKSHPIYLIQPYAKHYSVVRYPYKFRFFEKTQREYVYNLIEDPLEEKSVINNVSDQLLADFRKDLLTIYTSNSLLKKNQLRKNP